VGHLPGAHHSVTQLEEPAIECSFFAAAWRTWRTRWREPSDGVRRSSAISSGPSEYTLVRMRPQFSGARPSDGSRHLVRKSSKRRRRTNIRCGLFELASRNGGRPGGAPPYGFRVKGGELVVRPDRAGGRRPHHGSASCRATLRQIVRTLDVEGYATKRSGRWHPEAVRRILNRAAPPASDSGG